MCDIDPQTAQKNNGASCACHRAVLRAYKSLVKTGHPEICALQVAKIVYHHHHPEVEQAYAALTVERWVSGAMGQVH